MSGWVKLHRSMSGWEWYKDVPTSRLFMHFLLKAEYQDTSYRGHKIPAGSFITGRKELSLETGLSEQAVRTAIFKLRSTNNITIYSTKHFSVISIVNWNEYQSDQPTNQPRQQPADQPAVQPHLKKEEGRRKKEDKKEKLHKKKKGNRNEKSKSDIAREAAYRAVAESS